MTSLPKIGTQLHFPLADMPAPVAYATFRIIRDCNQAFADLFERTREDIINRSFARLYPQVSDFKRIGEMWGANMAGSKTYYDERIMKTATGRRFWCAVSGRSRTPDDPFAEAVYFFQPLGRPVDGERNILSQRLQQIMSLVARGKKNHEIADEIGLSVRTVEAHRARLMRKVGAKNGGELVAWFLSLPSS
ncbi:PAS and helix-turn-helix domain-containing protein [Allorhizobium terrae]|uniref:PAS and helix-turn-helix domain-containing protein n=2 Tax=Allorhizobium terrae TaxID=1848972 RepID=A0A4S3ZVW7_9HYPH|nr:PAS and helix-turn-helix domain-containing protein [Allorhizobium terrae]